MLLLENVNNATKQLILHIYFLQFKAQRVVLTEKLRCAVEIALLILRCHGK